jgi:hypothetical protein
LIGVGAYVAALKNVPLSSPTLFWVSLQVYHLFPALTRLPGSRVPMLVAAGAVGMVFFIFTIPLAYWLAGVFSRAGISSVDRQTLRLKRMRDASKKRTIDNDKHGRTWLVAERLGLPSELTKEDFVAIANNRMPHVPGQNRGMKKLRN